jgi:hypothetical protein
VAAGKQWWAHQQRVCLAMVAIILYCVSTRPDCAAVQDGRSYEADAFKNDPQRMREAGGR